MHVFNVLGKFTHKKVVPPSCYLLLQRHLLKTGLLVLGFPTTGFLSFLQHLGEHVLKLLNKLLLLTLRSAFVPFLTDWFLQKSCMPHRQEATESGYHPPANGIEKATHYTLHRRVVEENTFSAITGSAFLLQDAVRGGRHVTSNGTMLSRSPVAASRHTASQLHLLWVSFHLSCTLW